VEYSAYGSILRTGCVLIIKVGQRAWKIGWAGGGRKMSSGALSKTTMENSMLVGDETLAAMMGALAKDAKIVTVTLNIGQSNSNHSSQSQDVTQWKDASPRRPPKLTEGATRDSEKLCQHVQTLLEQVPDAKLVDVAKAYVLVQLMKGKNPKEVAALSGYNRETIRKTQDLLA